MKLNRLFLLVILFAFTQPNEGLAQNSIYYFQEVNTWEFGPRIGFTTSVINSKGDPDLKSGIKLGLVGGFFARYQLAEQWAIQGDLSYSTRGNKSEDNSIAADDNNIENGYVDFSIVPVRNVKFRMFKNDMTFDFFLGPGISFLTTAEEKISGTDLDSQLSSTEFNLVVGGGLPLGPFMLTATSRFGLANLIDEPIQDSKWHSITTEWTIAYRFK